MKRVASISFGKDSLAALFLLLENEVPLDEVIFYNSGMEFQAIYDIRDRMKPLLEQRGFFWEENGIRLYDILDQVSCWCCKNKNRKELKAIHRYLPQYWAMLKELQAQIRPP